MAAVLHKNLQPAFRQSVASYVKPKERVAPAQDFGNAHSTSLRALDCLRCNLATSKEWAAALHVSVRAIQQWMSGAETVPSSRVSQILFQAKRFLMRFDPLERWIDQALMETYGPHVDGGTF